MTMMEAVSGLFSRMTTSGLCTARMKNILVHTCSIPVQIGLRMTRNPNGSTVFMPGTIKRIDKVGMFIEIRSCSQCSGYCAGAIHQDCIFSQYDDSIKDSLTIALYAHIPGSSDVVRIRGKAVGIKQENGTETLRVRFAGHPGKAIEAMAASSGVKITI